MTPAHPPGSIWVDIKDGDGLGPALTSLIANTGSSYAGASIAAVSPGRARGPEPLMMGWPSGRT